MIRVSIIEDDAEERVLYAAIVDRAQNMSCVSQHPDGPHALRHLPLVRPDVVLIDIGLPKCSGIEIVRQLRALLPDVLPVMLTKYADDDHIFESLKAGAVGYLLKSQVHEALPGLIAQVLRDEVAISPEVARRVLAYFRQQQVDPQDANKLTAREEEVLRLVAQGLTSKEIGDRLGCATNTVDRHAQHICKKLRVRGRVAAASRYFGRQG